MVLYRGAAVVGAKNGYWMLINKDLLWRRRRKRMFGFANAVIPLYRATVSCSSTTGSFIVRQSLGRFFIFLLLLL